ncbi:MAG: hypothetical protein QNJ48_08270 [Desulfobacterales bacterium]|nr:hypothetical protein [Desulfobacterales bacterium]MDJ0884143.1 hypothetical protein [Desulfobacterales bacterium]
MPERTATMEHIDTTDRNILNGRPISPRREPHLGDDYLCQVGASLSCGACCGLYNVADVSRRTLERLLGDRTRRFGRVTRTIDGIMAFRREIETLENQNRPMPDFHHCPFLGFVGPSKETVGCMLHPLEPLNRGMDFRSLSHYGGMACHIYFCPATRLLPTRCKQIVRTVITDWYLYGLLVTEHRLLLAVFEEIEHRLNRQVFMDDFIHNAGAREALYNLFLLRVSWPFRRPGPLRLVNYFFNDHRHPRPDIPTAAEGQAIERYHAILKELETRTDSTEIVRQAELYLDDKLRLLQANLQS